MNIKIARDSSLTSDDFEDKNLKIKCQTTKSPIGIKWAASKQELVKRNSKNHMLFTKILHSSSNIRIKESSTKKAATCNSLGISHDDLGLLDLDEVLPKSSDIGYYYWIGKDYSNVYVEDCKEIHEPFKGIH